MIFPFSMWGADPFAGKIFTLQLFENFTGWFIGWTGKTFNLQLFENFTGWVTAIWASKTENLQLFENFSTGW